MKVTRHCTAEPIHWPGFLALPNQLLASGVTIRRVSIELVKYPDEITFDNIEDADTFVRTHGLPARYYIFLRGPDSNISDFSLHVGRGETVDGEPYHDMIIEGSAPLPLADVVMGLLRLTPATPVVATTLPRTVFIAHRFDNLGKDCADRLARFLTLIDFEVATGRGYAPGSVADKVRGRIQAQALLVAILTPGDDATWLVQESLLGSVQGKPLIVVRDSATSFKPALLADLEYIPFAAPHVEAAFIPLLEGLRALGYTFS
jgi:hypothetical protein